MGIAAASAAANAGVNKRAAVEALITLRRVGGSMLIKVIEVRGIPFVVRHRCARSRCAMLNQKWLKSSAGT
jgi:hypothetical protein